jgi:UDP-glucose 4-epimerase
MSKILVTGGAGFIGSHLVDELIKRGTDPGDIFVIDNLSTGKLENLQKEVPFRRIDLCHFTLVELFSFLQNSGITEVYHLAARARVQPSFKTPHEYIFDNVIGTQKLLEACRLAGVKKFVFASSSTVSYLNRPDGNSPYAVSKSTCEDLCKMYKDHYGIHTVSLRYFSVYGERMDLSLQNSTVLARILRCMIKPYEPFQLYGTGKNSRDFTYVDDIVTGTIGAMENIEKLRMYSYELGCTLPISIKELLKSVPDLVVEMVPKVREIPITMSSSGDANRDFGYGYRTYVKDWFKEQLQNLDYWKERLELYEN